MGGGRKRPQERFLYASFLEKGSFLGAVAVGLLLASCAVEQTPGPPPVIPYTQAMTPVPFSALPGWTDDAVTEALPAFRQSCLSFRRRPSHHWVGPGVLGGTVGSWHIVCDKLDAAFPEDEPADLVAFRTFLEKNFQPWAVSERSARGHMKKKGTFTGYYEAALKGCRTKTPTCQVPLYGPPPGAITGVSDVPPLPSRAAIERGALKDTAEVLLYAEDPVDVHILQIQGSGRVQLPNGDVQRIGFAGSNGHPFRGLGSILLRKGLVKSGHATMPHIRSWLKKHPRQAVALMWENPRYIFFRTLESTAPGPVGALAIHLTPQRSLAVDERYIPLGAPLWLVTHDAKRRPLQRLMFAQDKGSAIKGVVRGDFFWGYGEDALKKAGGMHSQGSWYLLLPKVLQKG